MLTKRKRFPIVDSHRVGGGGGGGVRHAGLAICIFYTENQSIEKRYHSD